MPRSSRGWPIIYIVVIGFALDASKIFEGQGRMAELVDALVLGTSEETHGGSSPLPPIYRGKM